ncbi:hypothetical protein RI845_06185 [Thalassotalea nanhaiensis]|uniref:DUF4129 domain-containing protein n=1 Tax=Thalassotalea nanhaiensis TaxID=3065648 RepID=A0ABY9TLX1_9GAMM|nr:hypothetical protein RI845_06185 [Colwelliaceae bacterium SQ345]
MTDIIVVLAISILVWMMWRLYQAKQYNKFIDWLNDEIKPQLLSKVAEELEENRSAELPNNECHQQAAYYFYQQYPVRIFEAAVAREIISQDWFLNKQNKRHASHLLFIQSAYRIHQNNARIN